MAALASYADAIRQRTLSGARPLVTSIDGVDLDELSGRASAALLPDDEAQGRVRQSSGRERHSSVSMLETPQLFGRATPILPTLAENAQCVGWLMKKASKFPWGWNERYFAFVPASGVLFYFSDDGSGVLSVRGRLQLKGVREGSPR